MNLFNGILGLISLVLLIDLISANVVARPGDHCNANNCLRALRAAAGSADSHAFCSAYIGLTTRTVTLTDIIATAIAPSVTKLPYTIFITIGTTNYATLIQTEIRIETATPTITQPAAVVPQDVTPTVPAYLSACSGSPSKLSSACSCYIGTTASDRFTTETSYVITGPISTETSTTTTTLSAYNIVYSTVTNAYLSTTTITSTIHSTPTTCRGPASPLTQVHLRIEGVLSTIFEGTILSSPRNITTPSGSTHHCDGTNNLNSPTPSATCTTALDEASCLYNFPYDGTFSSSFDDYFITSIGSSTQTDTQFWGLLLNYQFTSVGGCQQETREGDKVLWAYDAFNKVNFLEASMDAEFRTVTGRGNVGETKYLYVRDGMSGKAVAGAIIGGGVTDRNGRASVSFGGSGTYAFKAEKVDSVRSNAVVIFVGGK